MRQRDPSSPYLFLLAMEFQTLMLKKRIIGCKDFTFHPRCENMQLINLYFADDLMIFTRVDLLQVQSFKIVCKTFKVIFGL